MGVLRTTHLRCPECGGNVMDLGFRAANKGQMTIYGKDGVRHVTHKESRCQDCRHVQIKLNSIQF